MPRLYPDTRVRYALPVAARNTDRAAWAAEVARLINEEANGNKSEFARLVGTTYKTVTRWLNSQVDVDVASIFQIAEKLHRNPVPMLVKVGYLSSEHAPPPAVEPVDVDPVIDAVLNSDLPNRKKYALIERINAQRAQQQERELADVQWMIDQQRSA
jgi:transcriptional regulator with XRE-family HTH domain